MDHIIQILNFITKLFPNKCGCCGKFIKHFLAYCSVFLEYFCCCVSINASQTHHNQYKIDDYQKKIKEYWFLYCKLYVVGGYTKSPTAKEMMKVNVSVTMREETPHQIEDNCSCCNKSTICCNKNICSSKQKIRGLLLVVKCISTLVLVPLLLLQIFDTYSLLCFSPDFFCSHATEYQLNLLQAAIILFFYCSLLLSQLTSTLLLWKPWPKPDEGLDEVDKA